ncbi:unnamed protein product [Paramecium sonneborni]|uniref:Uncharacterized protein n=1 Tax=Paramecium sonneborni TaxID=65129 RepID=A0A8S1L086_9CILI|nr:unnamed protein product [Paramecium sonneborni]
MGCGGGKPQNQQKPQPLPGDLLELVLPNDKQSPSEKLEYILSQTVQEYLINKKTNYEQQITNLVRQMQIKNEEFQQYNDHLIEQFKKIDKHNDNTEIIQSTINFLSQELKSFINLKQHFSETDNQLQLTTFKFLFDLYHIVMTKQLGKEEQQYWSGQYMIQYEGYQNQSQNNQTDFKLEFLNQIQKSLKQNVVKATETILHNQRQQQLLLISQSKDRVMAKNIENQSENLVHYAKQQNQKYTINV